MLLVVLLDAVHAIAAQVQCRHEAVGTRRHQVAPCRLKFSVFRPNAGVALAAQGVDGPGVAKGRVQIQVGAAAEQAVQISRAVTRGALLVADLAHMAPDHAGLGVLQQHLLQHGQQGVLNFVMQLEAQPGGLADGKQAVTDRAVQGDGHVAVIVAAFDLARRRVVAEFVLAQQSPLTGLGRGLLGLQKRIGHLGGKRRLAAVAHGDEVLGILRCGLAGKVVAPHPALKLVVAHVGRQGHGADMEPVQRGSQGRHIDLGRVARALDIDVGQLPRRQQAFDAARIPGLEHGQVGRRLLRAHAAQPECCKPTCGQTLPAFHGVNLRVICPMITTPQARLQRGQTHHKPPPFKGLSRLKIR